MVHFPTAKVLPKMMASIFRIKNVCYFDYRLKGRRVRHRASDAQVKRLKITSKALSTIYPGWEKPGPKGTYVNEFIQEYLDYAKPN